MALQPDSAVSAGLVQTDEISARRLRWHEGHADAPRALRFTGCQCTKKEPRGDAGLGRRFHEANQFHPSANLAPVIGWGHFRSPDDCRCFAACVGYAFTSCPWSVPCRGVLETRPGPPKGAVCAAAAPPRGPLDQ